MEETKPAQDTETQETEVQRGSMDIVIAGQSGSGKSYLLQHLVEELAEAQKEQIQKK